jgi:hypothetical protein
MVATSSNKAENGLFKKKCLGFLRAECLTGFVFPLQGAGPADYNSFAIRLLHLPVHYILSNQQTENYLSG